MMSLKLGLLLGSLSQHLCISFVKASGVFFGMVGLMSLFSTLIDTSSPDKSKLMSNYA